MIVYRDKVTNECIVEVSKRIANTPGIFKDILYAHEHLMTLSDETVLFDFSNTCWFDANLSAVLGATFISLHENNNTVKIKGLSNAINDILTKNKFLSTFSIGSKPRTHDTTIDFKLFNKSDKIEFQEYIDNGLLPKLTIDMTADFKYLFASNLEEIYQNARTHGDSSKIITCGQWFPKIKKIKFTICDVGITIPENTKLLKPDLTPSQSIDWATEYGNSSKSAFETGGLGLYNLQSFIKKNKGKMHIISGNGYWGYSKRSNLEDLENYFDGTIVNLEIDLNDTNMYSSFENSDTIDNIETNSIIDNLF